MEQNKVRTYLLYAVGEILLVVIGILIALQVNNWNEQLNTEQVSRNTLQDLYSELQVVKSEVEQNIEFNQGIVEEATRYVTGTIPVDSLKSEPYLVFMYTNYLPLSPNFPVLERELSSDKLIQGQDKLITDLREINEITENIISSYTYLDEFWNGQVAPYFIKKRSTIYLMEEIRSKDLPVTLKKLEEIFRDEEYRNLAAMCMLFNEAAMNNASQLVEHIDTALLRIEEVIQNN